MHADHHAEKHLTAFLHAENATFEQSIGNLKYKVFLFPKLRQRLTHDWCLCKHLLGFRTPVLLQPEDWKIFLWLLRVCAGWEYNMRMRMVVCFWRDLSGPLWRPAQLFLAVSRKGGLQLIPSGSEGGEGAPGCEGRRLLYISCLFPSSPGKGMDKLANFMGYSNL